MQARVTTPASVPVSELFRSRREGKTQRTMLVKLKTQIFIVLQGGGGGGGGLFKNESVGDRAT